ncbi:MAG: maleylacetoacetate isomerase [Xanthobacteraceae bacterium]
MLLYNYFRSSAAFRVRIALNLKGLPYESEAVHLTRNGGAQFEASFRAINPQARVPALKLDDGDILIQSLALIEYLDETHPNPPLLPKDAAARAHVRAVAQIVACDIHPLNNVVVLNYLRRKLKQDDATVNTWYHHWVVAGFDAIEKLLKPGTYAFGDTVTLADVCLVPQVYNARRFKVSLDKYPKIVAADAACQKLAAFEKAKPENQPDAE